MSVSTVLAHRVLLASVQAPPVDGCPFDAFFIKPYRPEDIAAWIKRQHGHGRANQGYVAVHPLPKNVNHSKSIADPTGFALRRSQSNHVAADARSPFVGQILHLQFRKRATASTMPRRLVSGKRGEVLLKKGLKTIHDCN